MSLQVVPKPLQKEIHGLGLEIVVGQLAALMLAPTIFEKIQIGQESDPLLAEIKDEVLKRKSSDFSLSEDGILNFKGHLCVSRDMEMRDQILLEAYGTPYSIHPGTMKMIGISKKTFGGME